VPLDFSLANALLRAFPAGYVNFNLFYMIKLAFC